MRDTIRIPVFNEEYLFNVYEEIDPKEDTPDLKWIDSKWEPEVWESYVGPRYDKVSFHELARLLKFRTCPFCREGMKQILDDPSQLGVVLVCTNCFYWGGRGTRGQVEGPTNNRGILGRLSFTENPDEVPLEALIQHLALNSDKIIGLTPKQAEKVVPIILKDYMMCEVLAIGGTKDGGIDALAIKSNKEKIIVQIKWRENTNGAESVSLVREVGGTLLARGIPSGLIISTRKRFSPNAITEADLISQREILSIGMLNLELKNFNDLIDMFEVSALKRKDIIKPQDVIPYYDGFRLFG